MRQIMLFLAVVFTSTAFSQDSSILKKEFDYEAYLKSQHVKYQGKQFPEFSIKISDNANFSNADLKNKVVFINFWFESCSPCIAEMDGFNEMFNKLKGNPDFLFITFTFDSDSIIKKVVSKYNIEYKTFHIDRAECYRLNFENGFPTSFILDRKGLIRFYKTGGQIEREKSTKEVMTQIYPEILKIL